MHFIKANDELTASVDAAVQNLTVLVLHRPLWLKMLALHEPKQVGATFT